MTIVCGTDFSDASLGALAVARALAAQRGDREMVLVSVIDDDQNASSAQASLDAARMAVGPGVAIRTRIEVGDVGRSLLAVAASEASDLVVIAAGSRTQVPSHGGGAPGSAAPRERGVGSISQRFGQAAEEIVTAAQVPVLVLRNPEPWLAFAAGTKPLRVLISVDESVPCELGMQWTHALCARGSVDVVLGAVYYPDEAAEYYGLPAKPVVERDLDIENLLTRDLMRRFHHSDRVVARTKRGLGRIGDHVLELATEEAADAIVIGTSQKTGLGRLGSVSAVVVREGQQSVLCVPPNAKVPTLVVPTVTSVLVATDLSASANRAVSVALGTVPDRAEIHLLHVVDRDDDVDTAQRLSDLQASAPPHSSGRVTAHIVHSDEIGIAISQTAARLGCDLICLASRKKSSIARTVKGSIADHVVRATHKPVLIVGIS